MTDPSVNQNSETGTSTSLLQRSLANDPEAWARLVDLYGPLVYEWCRRWGLQPCDAENVGQETFFKVAKNLSRFRRTRPDDSFRGWLYRIARNTFVDYARRQRQEAAAEGGSDAQQFFKDVPTALFEEEEAPSSHENGILYRRALELIRGEFSDRDWQIMSRLAEGAPAQEVAAALNVSANVVYLTKSRVVRRLRAEFADLITDFQVTPRQRRESPPSQP